ncbi:MAG: hypothetical protein QHI48_06925 [Bacteroidota bacterium]|nr:hypothetical protein [Bacteroidota bacterium]
MKTGNIFFALCFIVLGLLALADNVVGLSWDWGTVRSLWPLILVFLGFTIVLRGRTLRAVSAGLAGVCAAVFLFALFQRGVGVIDWDGDDGQHIVHRTLCEEDDSTTRRAVFTFEGGAGSFRLEDTTASLLCLETESTVGKYLLKVDTVEGLRRFRVEQDAPAVNIGKKLENKARIRLNPRPEWDLNFDIGAASLDLDLKPFLVRAVTIDAGAATIHLTLGNRSPETTVRVESGVSTVKVRVPADADCEIHSEADLSSKSFLGFVKVENGLYRSKDYGSSGRCKIALTFESGVSSITVERY